MLNSHTTDIPYADNGCRLCLCSEGKINVLNNPQLKLKIMKCIRIKVEKSDGLPESICYECFNDVESFYKFKEHCQNSDFVLRNKLHKQYPLDITFPLHDSTWTVMESPAKLSNQKNSKREIDEIISGKEESTNNDIITPISKVKNVEKDNDKNTKAVPTRLHQCDKCGKHFTRSSHLVIHMRIHTGEKPYKCSKCEKSFSLRHTQQSHERRHTNVKPYQCLSCSQSFADSSSLNRHRKIHSHDKKYVCRFCPKRFIAAYELRRHKASHTGERLHACPTCSRTFIYESHLSKHKKTHIEATNEED